MAKYNKIPVYIPSAAIYTKVTRDKETGKMVTKNVSKITYLSYLSRMHIKKLEDMNYTKDLNGDYCYIHLNWDYDAITKEVVKNHFKELKESWHNLEFTYDKETKSMFATLKNRTKIAREEYKAFQEYQHKVLESVSFFDKFGRRISCWKTKRK